MRGETQARLTAVRMKSLASPGTHGNDKDLRLKDLVSGAKFWARRIIIDGPRGLVDQGGDPAVSPATARPIVNAKRGAVAGGSTTVSSAGFRSGQRCSDWDGSGRPERLQSMASQHGLRHCRQRGAPGSLRLGLQVPDAAKRLRGADVAREAPGCHGGLGT